MNTRLKADEVAVELPHWWYVEWSPLGAIKATKVDFVHWRNLQAFKDKTPAGYEPIGLFPTLEAAMDHVRGLRQMRREKHCDDDQKTKGIGSQNINHGDATGDDEHPVL